MPSFVRKNLLVISGKFFTAGSYKDADDIVLDNDADDLYPLPPQPSSAVCVVKFCTLTGGTNETTINLTLGADGVTWSGTWDSSLAGSGRVDWVVYSEGGVVSAAQGSFVIQANSANRLVT